MTSQVPCATARRGCSADGLEHIRRTSTQTHPLAEGEVPLVGNQATTPGNCPTATKTGERYGEIAANKVDAPKTPPGTTAIPGNADVLATVQDSLRYVITNDLTKRLKSRVDRAYYDPLSTHRTTEESVRRSANTTLAAAIMLSTPTGGTSTASRAVSCSTTRDGRSGRWPASTARSRRAAGATTGSRRSGP